MAIFSLSTFNFEIAKNQPNQHGVQSIIYLLKTKQKVEEEEGKKNSELSNDKCFSFNICTNTQPFA